MRRQRLKLATCSRPSRACLADGPAFPHHQIQLVAAYGLIAAKALAVLHVFAEQDGGYLSLDVESCQLSQERRRYCWHSSSVIRSSTCERAISNRSSGSSA